MPLVESFSGIRGIYGKELNESVAARYAYSYLSFLRNKTKKKAPTIVIGMDTRPSGGKLKEAIIAMLDCNFIDVGIAPTPAIEFAVRYFDADGGIIITASHNEPNWNGFKFLSGDGAVLNEKDMSNVIRNSESLKDFHKIQDRKVLERSNETIRKYSDFVLEIIGNEKIRETRMSKQKIVIDPNGGAGIIAKKILESIGVEVVGINMDYGNFKRQVEPTQDAMAYLKDHIDENNADFAAGFDCDADRVEILLKDGQLLSGNHILALVVQEILSKAKNPKSQTVVVNDATSGVVRDIAQRFGVKVKEVEVGETNVVETMKKFKSIVGGEGSSGGAIIWPSRCRDGILTLLSILSIVANQRKPLLEIVDELPKYYTQRKKIEYEAEKHDSIKKYLKEYYSKKGFEIRETGGIKGGLKVIVNKNSFVWFRASKTEPNIFRIISDSTNYNESQKLLEEAADMFKKASK